MEYQNKNIQNRTGVNIGGMPPRNLPEKRFTTGAISATIWRNEGLDKKGNRVEYRTITLQKRYLGKDGVWGTSNNLRVNDLPKMAVLLNKAYEYLVLKQNVYEHAGFTGVVKEKMIEEEIVI